MAKWASDEDRAAKYKAEADAAKQVRQLAMDGLTAEQKITIRKTYSTLNRVTNSILECQDIWLSDISELNASMWAMRKQFNLGGSDHVCDGFDEE